MGHAILQIMKGIAKTPGDTASAEQGLTSVDLLDPLGFSTDAYEMRIPALKSSAVYADSPLSDGRTLISGTLGNVTETIRVTLTAGTIVQMSAMLTKLMRMKQDCNDFWDTFGQIEPVYIKHQFDGEPGPRYALLYDIDIAVTFPTNPNDPICDVTIVIERETYWRGLAPGDNPKKWTLQQRSVALNINNAVLFEAGSQPQLAEKLTAVNALVWNAAHNSPTSQDFITIPAADIPGDAPALLYVAVDVGEGTAGSDDRLFMWRDTKPFSLMGRDAANRYRSLRLNGAKGTFGTDASAAADTGASSGSRARITFTGSAALINRIEWNRSSTTPIWANLFRGRYHAFLRARVSAAANVTLQLLYTTGSDLIELPSTTLSSLGGGGTGNTTAWVVCDMGVFDILPNAKAYSSAEGYGLNLPTSATDLAIALYASRNSGAGELYVNDLILVPLDESAILISASITQTIVVYDNTGYTGHGQTEDVAIGGAAAGAMSASYPIQGQPITLVPGVDNRLHFFSYQDSNKFSDIDCEYGIRVNIVPRWSGIRDV